MKKQKYIAINIILFAILFLLVTFNKEIIRPEYGNTPVIGIITGSFSNFLAAYIISLFAVSPLLSHKISIKKSRIFFYTVSVLVFVVLLIEEVKPFTGASKTYDKYDIIASGLGSILAIITFEIIIKRVHANRNIND